MLLSQMKQSSPKEQVTRDYHESQSVWKLRMEKQENDFKENRAGLREKVIEFASISKVTCSFCFLRESNMRCRTCRSHLCHNCDKIVHFQHVTHQRIFERDGCLYPLMPTQFFTATGSLESISKNLTVYLNYFCINYYAYFRCSITHFCAAVMRVVRIAGFDAQGSWTWSNNTNMQRRYGSRHMWACR